MVVFESAEKPGGGLSDPLASIPENASSPQLQDGQQYAVFLVEDDSDDRRQALRELRKSPHIGIVRSFESGDRLLKHFADEGYYSGNLMLHVPRLIILDIHVPGSDGREILKELKAHPLTENIPVVILTGDVSGDMESDAYKLRADAFLAKPLKLENIHQVLRTGRHEPDGRGTG